MADDIPGQTPASDTERPVKDPPAKPLQSVGPENETRGGPEAPVDSLDAENP